MISKFVLLFLLKEMHHVHTEMQPKKTYTNCTMMILKSDNDRSQPIPFLLITTYLCPLIYNNQRSYLPLSYPTINYLPSLINKQVVTGAIYLVPVTTHFIYIYILIIYCIGRSKGPQKL